MTVHDAPSTDRDACEALASVWNEAPRACPCGHDWADHAPEVGCMVPTHFTSGDVFCACRAALAATSADKGEG